MPLEGLNELALRICPKSRVFLCGPPPCLPRRGPFA